MSTRIFEGQVTVPEGARFVVVASRFNHFIVDRLVDGALDAIARHGGTSVEGAKLAEVSVVRVPGAWEIPWAVARIARPQPTNLAIIALGAVIRGSTPHFDYVASEVTKGIASVSLETGVPVAMGILTTDTIEQAIERAGTKAGNKGWEAALSAIELLNLGAALFKQGL
ncbi:MAG: 6,7-dimethyl-8-ribityllumazine synthase [Polyangiaceae bacterium]|jgi:6,7-dimethyl-8-ribityllumazine synthase|nr:6,7-dimethyl-8-ribityllumazine synthase [Polyangiaceae bacterium]MBK8937718.1 6,7-dimethyl-8-ribityllumazine synthase [Polyangiaceae bacterium]